MKHISYSAALLCAYPLVSMAHGKYMLDEKIATIWGNPIALLGIAIASGLFIGGIIFIVRRNNIVALKVGVTIGMLMFLVLFVLSGKPLAQTSAPMPGAMLAGAIATVYKSPTCGCCGGYIEELKRQGASVDVQVVSDADLAKIKIEHNIAPELHSCHTSIIDGYVVEGHVPIEAVAKLRTELPDIKGIALPGMPSGTPGMPGPKFGSYEVQSLDGKEFMKI